MSLIPESLEGLPVLLLLDDTLQAKFGTKFECYQTLFDHAGRNGSSYLKGHCFVGLAVCVPVIVENTVKYLTVPLRFRLRGENENKLTIASEMITDAMAALAECPMVICCATAGTRRVKFSKALKHMTAFAYLLPAMEY